MHSIVLGAGRLPSRVLLCGEAPGREEAARGLPFIGESGREQDRYLARHSLCAHHWYRTNVVKAYLDGNPDPAPSLIAEWTPMLEAEVRECSPLLIVAVGRYAARWFLGDDCEMSDVHGIPHRPGAFDSTLAPRSCGAVVLPIYHPAAGLHEPTMRGTIAGDYAAVAETLRRLTRGEPIAFREDEFEGREDYRDVTGADLASLIYAAMPDEIALDTEGEPGDEWSIQVSWRAGTGYVLRCEQPDFAIGVEALSFLVAAGSTFILHNASTPDYAMYDVIMCRGMGLELRHAKIADTMYKLYLRHESQGLKSAAYRHAGMRMEDYMSLVGEIGREKAIAYLRLIRTDILPIPRFGKRGQRIKDGAKKITTVLDPTTGERVTLPEPEPRLEYNGDGTWSAKNPAQLGARAEKIIADIEADKRDKSGNRVDPHKRWKQIQPWLREPAERIIGAIPRGHLRDIPRARAVWYAARDPDATFRVMHSPRLETKPRLFEAGMAFLPIVEEMQTNGMPVYVPHFRALYDDANTEAHALQSRISHLYNGDRPINPGSSKQVAALCARLGIRGLKLTPSGEMSTDKNSLQYLRAKHPAISDIFDCREVEHVRDAFVVKVLETSAKKAAKTGVISDYVFISGSLKSTRTTSRRLAETDPNRLAFPVRTNVGRRVRDGFICPPGLVFGGWDLSQVEMRFAAHESADKFLCELFNSSDRDVHYETAARIFKLPVDLSISDAETRYVHIDSNTQRAPAKNTGFGILFGISPGGLLVQLQMLGIQGWTEETCGDVLIEGWLDTFPGIRKYIEETSEQARRVGYVEDFMGHTRLLPAMYSGDRALIAEAGRHAVSHKIQAGAQSMIQNSMIWLAPRIRAMQARGADVRWALQIHDEIILIFAPSLWDELNALVTEALTQHSGIKLRVPVLCKGHCSETWGELK